MARSSFFTRSHLILPTLLSLQLFASGTQARRLCNADDQDDFDCDDSDEDPATRKRKAIIAASVLGGGLLLILIAYLIYVWRKRRTRAKQAPAYAFADMQGYANNQGGGYPQGGSYLNPPQGGEFPKGGGYASPQAPPPPGQPSYHYTPGYGNSYGRPAPGQGY
ncbi:hypothetical protein B0H16DRAFT_1500258 [Mycena metata]|uniref:Uncharacterized protein n=1 Tax=Mycena metata TaxID=1033252 RepID=A0AAD7K7G1_9AGAR|nr:hypothetical protein B0H16DRAFT_1500258 [Mycena metata]